MRVTFDGGTLKYSAKSLAIAVLALPDIGGSLTEIINHSF